MKLSQKFALVTSLTVIGCGDDVKPWSDPAGARPAMITYFNTPEKVPGDKALQFKVADVVTDTFDPENPDDDMVTVFLRNKSGDYVESGTLSTIFANIVPLESSELAPRAGDIEKDGGFEVTCTNQGQEVLTMTVDSAVNQFDNTRYALAMGIGPQERKDIGSLPVENEAQKCSLQAIPAGM